MAGLKEVYRTDTKELAETELLNLSGKLGKKHLVVIQSWKANWEKLTTYFQYTASICKVICTTNALEDYHRQIRKVAKTWGAFTSDIACLKLVYLTMKNIEREGTLHLQNSSLIIQQLVIKFRERLTLHLAEGVDSGITLHLINCSCLGCC